MPTSSRQRSLVPWSQIKGRITKCHFPSRYMAGLCKYGSGVKDTAQCRQNIKFLDRLSYCKYKKKINMNKNNAKGFACMNAGGVVDLRPL